MNVLNSNKLKNQLLWGELDKMDDLLLGFHLCNFLNEWKPDMKMSEDMKRKDNYLKGMCLVVGSLVLVLDILYVRDMKKKIVLDKVLFLDMKRDDLVMKKNSEDMMNDDLQTKMMSYF
jgi:hypothetical protein